MKIMNYRPLFLVISFLLITISAISILKWGFVYSSDFVGGSEWEISSDKKISSQDIEKIFSDNQLSLSEIKIQDQSLTLRFPYINQDQKLKIFQELLVLDPSLKELKFETRGPVLGQELIRKTVTAVALSSLALLLFIASKFKDFSFGASAVIAMFHDAFILIGAFSIFGKIFGAQLDSLFVTALLTTLSASVHDTVVTFDRIRELKRKNYTSNWVDLANQAVSEVIVRSLNNSLTIIFMLAALVLLGGEATRWFATALLVGVVCGTYSSVGVAIPLVLFWKKKK